MSRHAMHPTYRLHYACFNCHMTFRKQDIGSGKCPNCGGQLRSMGRDFRAPRASDKKAWQAVKLYYRTLRLKAA